MRRRIIIHNTLDKAVDVVGSAAEVAFGEGYHNGTRGECPYRAPELKEAWERGRSRAKNEGKFKKNYFQGELRNRRFEQPRPRDSSHGYAGFSHQEDYKTERGYIGRIYTLNGSQVAASQPFISERSALNWIREKTEEFAKAGRTVTGKASQTFFDPAYGQ